MNTALQTEMTTEQILKQMLTENTGRHILDSGGAYGRNWERNQGRDFDSEPECTVNFRWGVGVTANLYHWLKQRVHYEPEMDSIFYDYAELPGNEDESWFELAENFPKWLAEQGHEVDGISDKREGPITGNTYNSDNILSQDFWYMRFCCDNYEYVMIMIHGGCDIRGGYTAPRIFQEVVYDYSLYDTGRCTICCTNPVESHSWDTDSAGYYWDGNFGDGLSDNFGKNFIKEDELYSWLDDNYSPPVAALYDELMQLQGMVSSFNSDLELYLDGVRRNPDGNIVKAELSARAGLEQVRDVIIPSKRAELVKLLGGNGAIFVDGDGNGYCPECGYKLEAYL